MKVTRSYWFGLGSGLILSAMLTLVFAPQQKISDVQSMDNSQSEISMTEQVNQADVPSPVQANEPALKENLPTEEQTPTQVILDFVVPKGASAERIAELLFDQGFIKDKAAFLQLTHQMRAERQFRAGTFSLSLGLTEEELIHRLLK
ncbi:hypothetical protein [Desulfosporosinus youngiae]|uniref:Putative periplasmic solute-binding protein n=1 Tax=Desulfosporosinus youngiae DSM 17734 TaxID=768710 RepID=H5XRW2_9FIRM|nr:hypothetical protein [Desulfosporosinus youngiae]EHQ87499.1 putative periplasmic solute-binding protein [Desulfosporosinus youngiae DSM 17734]